MNKCVILKEVSMLGASHFIIYHRNDVQLKSQKLTYFIRPVISSFDGEYKFPIMQVNPLPRKTAHHCCCSNVHGEEILGSILCPARERTNSAHRSSSHYHQNKFTPPPNSIVQRMMRRRTGFRRRVLSLDRI